VLRSDATGTRPDNHAVAWGYLVITGSDTICARTSYGTAPEWGSKERADHPPAPYVESWRRTIGSWRETHRSAARGIPDDVAGIVELCGIRIVAVDTALCDALLAPATESFTGGCFLCRR
jgi:hypothetical protein